MDAVHKDDAGAHEWEEVRARAGITFVGGVQQANNGRRAGTRAA